jgi:hypothetical protein
MRRLGDTLRDIHRCNAAMLRQDAGGFLCDLGTGGL